MKAKATEIISATNPARLHQHGFGQHFGHGSHETEKRRGTA